jgi:hypothetical protein
MRTSSNPRSAAGVKKGSSASATDRLGYVNYLIVLPHKILVLPLAKEMYNV